MSEVPAEGKDGGLHTPVKQTVENSPKTSKDSEDRTPETFSEGNKESGDTPVKQPVENSPEFSKVREDRSLSLEKESEVKSSDTLEDTSEDMPPSVEQSHKNDSPKLLAEEMESLTLADKSPVTRSLKSEGEGSQSKPKTLTPNKPRSRARSVADVFESPYNTRLKAKLLREREQRSSSEDSRKRDAKQK